MALKHGDVYGNKVAYRHRGNLNIVQLPFAHVYDLTRCMPTTLHLPRRT